MNDTHFARKEFWEERASLGDAAGSDDLVAKQLEINNILKYIPNQARVLDAGCGNGTTAIKILEQKSDVDIHAFDYAANMIEQARKLAEKSAVSNRLKLVEGCLLNPPFSDQQFDIVYTERALINLNSEHEQNIAIKKLLDRTKDHGKLLLCEAFIEGHQELNLFRTSIGLPKINQPWHNNFLSLNNIKQNLPDNVCIDSVVEFSSTYYFLSRVINAWYAKNAGIEPSYDAPINKLALMLPSINACSRNKLIVIKKEEL